MRRSLEFVSLIVLGWMGWLTWSALAGPNPLPGRIPTHFNAAGNPDGWGTPAMLLLLPLVGFALYAIITVVSRFPSAFNYPVRIRPQVRQQVESLTLNMIGWIKAETGSFPLAIMPIAALAAAGTVAVLLVGRGQARTVAIQS